MLVVSSELIIRNRDRCDSMAQRVATGMFAPAAMLATIITE